MTISCNRTLYTNLRKFGIILSITILMLTSWLATASAEPISAETKSKSTEYYNNGLAQFKAKQYEEAVSWLDKALALNPDHEDAYGLRGLAHEQLRNYKQAIADFSKAISLNPQQAGKYFLRGRTYYWNNQL